MNIKCLNKIIPMFFLAYILIPISGEASRLKDITNINGVRNNQLIGFGLVLGLDGSGDSSNDFTNQSAKMMLQRMGISSTGRDKVRNIASVMVTAVLPPFSRQGTGLDATLSSMGDAKSLRGGVLILTPLKGPDGKIYAVAQGPISVGGGVSAGGNNAKVSKGHTTVARVIGGAIVERELDFDLEDEKIIQLALKNQDFSTAVQISRKINEVFGEAIAFTKDSGTVSITVPNSYHGRISNFIARFEKIQIDADVPAKIVINERTGTVVVGENVRVSTVALTHGSLSISVKEEGQKYVREEGPFGYKGDVLRDDQTGDLLKESQNTDISIEETDANLAIVEEGVTLKDLVRGLNKLGVTPMDLIAIIQSLKVAGAIQGELEII